MQRRFVETLRFYEDQDISDEEDFVDDNKVEMNRLQMFT